MNKKYFSAVSILMVVSLIGIIVIQSLWVRNAFKVKDELFKRSVDEALTSVIRKLETNESISIITHSSQIIPGMDSTITGWMHLQDSLLADLFSTPEDWSPIFKDFINIGTNTELNKDFNDSETIIKESFYINKNGKKTHIESISSYNKASHHSKINNKIEQLNQIARQMIHELKSSGLPIQKRLNAKMLNSTIKSELKNKGVELNFEFKVTQKDVDIFHSKGFNPHDGEKVFIAKLFPNDIIHKNDYLTIYFPEQTKTIFHSLRYLIIGSTLFTLIILTTFIFTTLTIRKQKKINDIKTDFINNMTHEFKTPLATINLAADSICSHKIINNPEHILHFAKIIKDENNRMNNQVEKVLQISQIEKQDFPVEIDQVNALPLIEKAIKSITLQINDKKGTITTAFNALNHVVLIDPTHFTNIIFNLLDNAVKYSKDVPEISLETSNVNDMLIIKVTDKGIGISKEHQKLIFEKFFRVQTGNIHNVKGFGLGLSYVKKMIEQFNGYVTIESQINKGSTFSIHLPIVNNKEI